MLKTKAGADTVDRMAVQNRTIKLPFRFFCEINKFVHIMHILFHMISKTTFSLLFIAGILKIITNYDVISTILFFSIKLLT